MIIFTLWSVAKIHALELLTWEDQTTQLKWAYIEKQLDPGLTNQLSVNVQDGVPWSLTASSPALRLAVTNGIGPSAVRVSYIVTNNWVAEKFTVSLDSPAGKGAAYILLSKNDGFNLMWMATDLKRNIFYGTQCEGDYNHPPFNPVALVEMDPNSGKAIRTHTLPFLNNAMIVNTNLDLLVSFGLTRFGDIAAGSISVYHLPDFSLVHRRSLSPYYSESIASAGNYIAYCVTNNVFLLDARTFQLRTNYVGRNPWFNGDGSRFYFGSDTNLSIVDIRENGDMDLRTLQNARAPLYVSPVNDRIIMLDGILRGLDASGAPYNLETNRVSMQPSEIVQPGHVASDGSSFIAGSGIWINLAESKVVRLYPIVSMAPAMTLTRDGKQVARQSAKEIRIFDFPKENPFFINTPIPTELFISANKQHTYVDYDFYINNFGTSAYLRLYYYDDLAVPQPESGFTAYAGYYSSLSTLYSPGEYSFTLSNAMGMATSSVMRVRYVKPPEVFPVLEARIGNLTSNIVLSAEYKNTASVGGANQSIVWLKDGLPFGTNAVQSLNTLSLTNLQPSDEGIYTMVVTNISGKATYTCVLKLLPPGGAIPSGEPPKIPLITNTSTNIVTLEGAPLTLTALLLEQTDVRWQWYFNGTLLPGVTTKTLALDHVTLQNSGVFSVTASNSVGVSTATIATVQVNPIQPAFTKIPPVNVSRNIGDSLDIDFGVQGSPSALYWFFNGDCLPWATNYVFHLDNLQVTNAGVYYAIMVTPSGPVTSSGISLRVAGLFPPFPQNPVINSQFSTFILPVGASKSLQVAATGNDPLLLQWMKNGQDLPNQNTSSLLFTNLQASDSGSYSVRASNSFGVVTAQVADIIVGYPPQPSIILTNLLMIEGSSLDLSVTAQNQVLSTAISRNFETPRAATGFHLDSVGIADSGFYQIVSSNQFGSSTNTFSVLVYPRPGKVRAWGDNTYFQSTSPANLKPAVAVAAGLSHSLALHADGTVSSWGAVSDTSFIGSLSNVVQVSAADDFTAFLFADGRSLFWNENTAAGFTTPEDGLKLASMQVTRYGVVGLTENGVVGSISNNISALISSSIAEHFYRIGSSINGNDAFNSNGYIYFSADGKSSPVSFFYINYYSDPPVNLSSSPLHTYELLRSGKIYGYGDNHFGQLATPANVAPVASVAVGLLHSYALQKNGLIRGWGDNSWGQVSQIPTNRFRSIASGSYHGLGIEGELKAYGKKAGTNLVLDWPYEAVLESSPNVTGPYSPVSGAVIPYTTPPTNGIMFYRLRTNP